MGGPLWVPSVTMTSHHGPALIFLVSQGDVFCQEQRKINEKTSSVTFTSCSISVLFISSLVFCTLQSGLLKGIVKTYVFIFTKKRKTPKSKF